MSLYRAAAIAALFPSSAIGRRAPEITGPLVMEDMQLAGAIDQRSVGIAVAIEIDPDKLLHAGNSSKGMYRGKRSIAVVS